MIERYVGWLRDDHERVAEGIRAAIRAETPAYASFADHEAEAAWATGIDRGLTMFIEGVADNRGLTADERTAMEAIGRDRAEQGFPLDAIAASIAVAARVAYDWVITRQDDSLSTHDRAALCELSTRLTTFANEITAAALHTYLARREALATSAEQARARLFHDVLSGRAGSADAAAARAAALDTDLTVPWAVVLLPPAPRADSLERELLASLPGAVLVPMATAAIPHTALVVPAPPAAWATLRRTLDAVAVAHTATVLVVGPCADVVSLHRRYSRAQVLVSRLPLPADGAGLLDADDLREAALLATVPADTGLAFVDDVLGPIERRSRTKAARLLRTLESLVTHDNSVKAAAAALDCNPKTIRSHAKEIEELTGLSFDCLLHLRWFGTALLLRRLDGTGPSPAP